MLEHMFKELMKRWGITKSVQVIGLSMIGAGILGVVGAKFISDQPSDSKIDLAPKTSSEYQKYYEEEYE